MVRYFFDSSALVKQYHAEGGSSVVNSLFEESGNRLLISRLALVEVHSALARLVREEVLSEKEFAHLSSLLREDVASGKLRIIALSIRTLEEASQILSSFGLKNPLRTLDAIHLATASLLHKRTPFAAFAAADKQLLATAAVWGLPVLDVGK
jgi:uncharacterized protein